LHLTLGDKTSIPLAGKWKGQLSVDARPPQPLPIGYENWPVMPSVLYEGMLAPIAPLSITGALWYQGEQNSDRGFQYRRILPVMIADWRKLFGQGDFPFYIVSLPAFLHRSETPTDDTWAETRESQALRDALYSAIPASSGAVFIWLHIENSEISRGKSMGISAADLPLFFFNMQGHWVQSWVQLDGLFQPKTVRKLRQINESFIGYEPEGREFESLRAHHSYPVFPFVPPFAKSAKDGAPALPCPSTTRRDPDGRGSRLRVGLHFWHPFDLLVQPAGKSLFEFHLRADLVIGM
jgi:hypothetical protein